MEAFRGSDTLAGTCRTGFVGEWRRDDLGLDDGGKEGGRFEQGLVWASDGLGEVSGEHD